MAVARNPGNIVRQWDPDKEAACFAQSGSDEVRYAALIKAFITESGRTFDPESFSTWLDDQGPMDMLAIMDVLHIKDEQPDACPKKKTKRAKKERKPSNRLSDAVIKDLLQFAPRGRSIHQLAHWLALHQASRVGHRSQTALNKRLQRYMKKTKSVLVSPT